MESAELSSTRSLCLITINEDKAGRLVCTSEPFRSVIDWFWSRCGEWLTFCYRYLHIIIDNGKPSFSQSAAWTFLFEKSRHVSEGLLLCQYKRNYLTFLISWMKEFSPFLPCLHMSGQLLGYVIDQSGSKGLPPVHLNYGVLPSINHQFRFDNHFQGHKDNLTFNSDGLMYII